MALDIEEYLSALRDFIKDHEAFNRLLKFEKENEDNYLRLYLNMALGFLDAIPPYIGPFGWATFPIPNLIVHQATIECLISNSIVQARNELAYNNGGITVKISDGNRYLNILQILYRATDMEIKTLTQIKIAINIQSGFGGVSSPYAYLHSRSAILNPNSILDG